ncbi:MAG: VanZ family protein [Jhaorihella sp.]
MTGALFSATHPAGRAARRKAALGVTAVLAVAIGLLTLLPLAAPPGMPGADKSHHVIAFAALTLPCALLHPRLLVWLLPAAVLYGGAIEIVQPSVGREGEWADFLADALGAGFGTAAGFALRLLLKRWLARDRATPGAG